MLIVLRGELVVCEECNRVTWTFLIKLDTRRKDMDRYIGIIPKLHRQHVTCEVPRWRRDNCSNAKRGPRRSETLQHFLVPHRQQLISRAMTVSYLRLDSTAEGAAIRTKGTAAWTVALA